ncbi:MAG: hypothetical protein KIT72_12285 [Polyangiaceae bacterium]|nr:hypothetical protein [Polyangiaceae bacterium]MCW5791192.1 hypothetical protein [Polyangiaceae bacterium]
MKQGPKPPQRAAVRSVPRGGRSAPLTARSAWGAAVGYCVGLGALGYLTLFSPNCSFERPLTTNFGYEVGDQDCSDGIDNDYDQLIDCQDPDCVFTSTWCGELIPDVPPDRVPESTFELCTDGIDNDDDGTFDCGDRGCQAIRELCCSLEWDDASCSDGIDNDGNNFADCADFSCRNSPFVTVCRAPRSGPEKCATGDDCFGPENTFERCFDGKDNDGNGYADCADFSCSQSGPPSVVAECAARAENTIEKCSDGIDNDGNGFADCADFSCSQGPQEVAAFCAERAENTLEKCSDGKDNDGNGFADCADYSCSRDGSAEAVAYCATVIEATPERCRDGIDNDGNGYADCADNSCRNLVPHVCQETYTQRDDPDPIATANARCSDGIDNDGDGFVDCDDWDCNYDPRVTVCPGKKVCQ